MNQETADIVRRHGPMVWQIVYRLAGGSRRNADAADCFQEVFVAALEVGQREQVRNWEAMLRRLATLKGLDAIRRRIRERGRADADADVEELTGPATSLRDSLENTELIEELRHSLAQLPEQQSEAFCLRHISGMSYEEVAGAMGMTVNAVGVVLSRAKARLQELMKKNSPADEVRYG